MKGLTVQGYVADKRKYASMPLLFFREKAARIKAFWEVQINRKPRFYGNKIPIKGNSINSHD
jgi:vancomycin permeability regulator SanA